MKLLWIARWDSRNPTDGQLLYSEGLISSLAPNGASVEVLATIRSETRDVAAVAGRTHLDPWPWPRFMSLFSNLPSDAAKQRTGAFARALRAALDRNPDAIIFDYYATGWALDVVKDHCAQMGRNRPLIVYLSHNHEASLRLTVADQYVGNPVMRWIVRHDAEKAARLEDRLVAAADLVVTNTDEDAALYRASAPDKQYVTIVPAYGGPIRAAGAITSATSRRVIMMGSLLWIAKQENLRRFVEAANDRFSRHDIQLYVLGRSDRTFLDSIERMSPMVKALGFVDDPLPYLYDSRIGLMPDELGGGFKHRVVNYIFNGVPVATIRSQAAGLPVDLDVDLIAADTVSELVDAIVEAIDDIDRLNAMAERVEAKCEGKFDWPGRGKALLDAIRSVRERHDAIGRTNLAEP